MALFTIQNEFRYEIVRKIFEGGMGMVYEAEQNGTRQFVKRVAVGHWWTRPLDMAGYALLLPLLFAPWCAALVLLRRREGRASGAANAPLPRPARELKGFAKVSVNPGEVKHVEVVLAAEAFAYWSPEKKDWVTDAGASFSVEAGHSERDLKLKERIRTK